jgi:hypothetical protein
LKQELVIRVRGDPTDTTSDLQKKIVCFKGTVTPDKIGIFFLKRYDWVGLDHFKDRE